MSGLDAPQRDYGAGYYRRELHRWINLFTLLEDAVKRELERNPDTLELEAEYKDIMREVTPGGSDAR